MTARATANGHGAFDLDAAVAAAAAEAGAEPFRFTWRGEPYEVPTATEWPLTAMAALAEGDLPAAMGMLLGDESYARLVAAGSTLGTLRTLFDAIAKASGLEGLPNSPASPPLASTRT